MAVYHWRSGQLSEAMTYAADEHGLRAFTEYLTASPLLPTYFLVDLVEEEFRQETIPHVFGSDRRALIRTRQTRLFPRSSIRRRNLARPGSRRSAR